MKVFTSLLNTKKVIIETLQRKNISSIIQSDLSANDKLQKLEIILGQEKEEDYVR